MKEEFNLSEKLFGMRNDCLDAEDVREFIKVIEEDYQKEWDKATDECKIIDKNKLKEILIKRAGEKLKDERRI